MNPVYHQGNTQTLYARGTQATPRPVSKPQVDFKLFIAYSTPVTEKEIWSCISPEYQPTLSAHAWNAVVSPGGQKVLSNYAIRYIKDFVNGTLPDDILAFDMEGLKSNYQLLTNIQEPFQTEHKMYLRILEQMLTVVRGHDYLIKEQPNDAKREFEIARSYLKIIHSAHFPHSYTLLYSLFKINVHLGDEKEAAKMLKSALHINPNNIKLLESHIGFYYQKATKFSQTKFKNKYIENLCKAKFYIIEALEVVKGKSEHRFRREQYRTLLNTINDRMKSVEKSILK